MLEDSAKHYNQTISLMPTHAFAWFNLGLQWARIGQWEAVELMSNDPDSHLLLISALLEIESTQALNEALEVAREGVRHLSDNPDVHFKLGYVLLRFAQRDDAAREFRIFINLAKHDPAEGQRVKYVEGLLEEMSPYLSP